MAASRRTACVSTWRVCRGRGPTPCRARAGRPVAWWSGPSRSQPRAGGSCCRSWPSRPGWPWPTPACLQLVESADRLLDRDLRIGPVELVQRDLVEPQPPQAALAGPPEVSGPSVGYPASRAGPGQAALGRDDEVIGIGVQGLGDQVLADFWAVGVRGVDERDAELHRTPERCLGHVPVWRMTPRCPDR
jgi:hypothetical protein